MSLTLDFVCGVLRPVRRTALERLDILGKREMSSPPDRFRPLLRRSSHTPKGSVMKYLLLIHSNPITWGHPSFLHTEEGKALPRKARDALEAQLNSLLDELDSSGELINAVPLDPPSRTRVVRVREGVRATTDGPYSEAKEQLAGVFLIDV